LPVVAIGSYLLTAGWLRSEVSSPAISRALLVVDKV
jgi:hypothetical protein